MLHGAIVAQSKRKGLGKKAILFFTCASVMPAVAAEIGA
jgi:hypothetical protein